MAKALNLGVLAWSPLAAGVLSGKYHGEGKADGARMNNEARKAFLPEEHRATPIISALKSVSEQVGRSMAQVALAWLRHRTVPVIPIIGARKVPQLRDNLASLDLELSAEQIEIPGWSKPNRARFPPEYLRQRNGSCNSVRRHVGSLAALSAALHEE